MNFVTVCGSSTEIETTRLFCDSGGDWGRCEGMNGAFIGRQPGSENDLFWYGFFEIFDLPSFLRWAIYMEKYPGTRSNVTLLQI